VFNPVVRLVELGMVGLSSSVIPSLWSIISILSSEVSLLRQMGTSHSRTQSPSYARSTERDEGLWPNPYQTGI
jgi:hypothetical protein